MDENVPGSERGSRRNGKDKGLVGLPRSLEENEYCHVVNNAEYVCSG